MKKIFTIIVLLLSGLADYGQKDSMCAKKFQLIGKLKEEIGMPPGCGEIAFGTVGEFEVINLTGMLYTDRVIRIIITCPDMYKEKFFEKGRTYHMLFSCTNQADFEWTVANRRLLERNHLP